MRLIIMVLTLASVLGAARSFTSASSDKLNCGSSSGLDNASSFSVLAWVYLTSTGTNDMVTHKGTAGTGADRYFRKNPSDNLIVKVDRASTDLFFETNNFTPTTNAWSFWAATADISGNAGKIYSGSLTVAAAEHTYGTATGGSGGATAHNAASFLVGNDDGNNGPVAGRIAVVLFCTAIFDVNQIISLQFRPRVRPNCLVFLRLGLGSPEPDLTGSGNNCTVTGTTIADHVPLGSWFGSLDFIRRHLWASHPEPLSIYGIKPFLTD